MRALPFAALLVLPSIALADARDYRLLEIRRIAEGGRVAWSPDGSVIAFDRRGEGGFWDLWTMRPDGTEQVCLTCDRADLAGERQIGQPAWHPSGEWIAIQIEKADHRGGGHPNPGQGRWHDLYVLHVPTGALSALTDVSDGEDGTPSGGTLHPVFSHDGARLMWTDMQDYCAGCGIAGDWRILVADFETDGARARVENTIAYEPGENRHWYETHGFGPDDSWIYFAGNLIDQGELNSDIHRMSLADPDAFERLTFTGGHRADEPGGYDEHAHFTRDFDAFVWLNDEAGRAEYWIANADGSDRFQLTGFNVEGTIEHELAGDGRIVPSDNSWNPAPPDGREQLAAYAQLDWNPLTNTPDTEAIFVLEFAREPGGGGPRQELVDAARRRGCAAAPNGRSGSIGWIAVAIALAARKRRA
jgi:hypothetical protein